MIHCKKKKKEKVNIKKRVPHIDIDPVGSVSNDMIGLKIDITHYF